MLPKHRLFIFMLVPFLLHAQEKSEFQQIIDRLDRLEQENRSLTDEVRALRAELAAHPPGESAAAAAPDVTAPSSPPSAPIEERVTIQERRADELAQTKVETSQRFPVTLTGMALFNAFLNGRATGGQQDPLTASLSDNRSVGGAGMRQSIIGLTFHGPQVWGGGQVNGALYMDLWGGSSSSLNHLVRMRVATVQIDWKNQTLVVGQDKPLISPREPNSLAQVAFSPLTAAGNLWLWGPQVRFEQRFSMGENAGLRAQAGVYQTSEPASSVPAEYQASFSAARPALEGRFEFWRKFGSGGRVEIAPGFHVNQTHVGGVSIPSDLFTIDWMIQPVSKLQFTGMFFQGENTAGIGGLPQGFTIKRDSIFQAVGAAGGWAQLSFLATKRLTLNAYSGQESDRAANLLAGQITRNFAYAGNGIYHLASNVLFSLEAAQVRTTYLGFPQRLVNHYDLALAYLF
ncbi:MAG TPA: hypothetical protein VK687_04805 [Bryobacteraceae bacterium]|nr:hypothetical protein [Bryobacteraceae bacterium]